MKTKKRRFAISDIHGCLDSFQALLEKISFTKEDQLFLLGDYIDRGPNSKGVIDHIWHLQENGFTVKCLRGNHEQMLIDHLVKPGPWYNGLAETIHSFGVSHNKDIPKNYIHWMDQLDYFVVLDDFILVHAGLNFNKEAPLEDLSSMIWMRYWYDQIDKDWLGDRIIVHGHTPTKQLDIIRSLKELVEIPALNIDAGCVFQSFGLGHLCALNLDDLQFTFQARLEKISY